MLVSLRFLARIDVIARQTVSVLQSDVARLARQHERSVLFQVTSVNSVEETDVHRQFGFVIGPCDFRPRSYFHDLNDVLRYLATSPNENLHSLPCTDSYHNDCFNSRKLV